MLFFLALFCNKKLMTNTAIKILYFSYDLIFKLNKRVPANCLHIMCIARNQIPRKQNNIFRIYNAWAK